MKMLRLLGTAISALFSMSFAQNNAIATMTDPYLDMGLHVCRVSAIATASVSMAWAGESPIQNMRKAFVTTASLMLPCYGAYYLYAWLPATNHYKNDYSIYMEAPV